MKTVSHFIPGGMVEIPLDINPRLLRRAIIASGLASQPSQPFEDVNSLAAHACSIEDEIERLTCKETEQ